jgi:hypothetical protein
LQRRIVESRQRCNKEHPRLLPKKIIGTARLKAFAVPFERAFKASEDVRHLNVVVVVASCVNELSLLSGFLGRFLLAALFRGLLLSCHSVVSPSLAFWL